MSMQEHKQQWSRSMEETKYILIGAGGHASVVASCIEAMEGALICVFDSDTSIASMDDVENKGTYLPTEFPSAKLILAIGDNSIRKRLVPTIRHAIGTVIHPSALVDRLVSIGEGSQVLQGAIINRRTNIGKHCIVNTKASIDHDCTIGDFVHIAPGATICGGVQIAECSLVGAGATILPNVQIGKNVIVGAGAVVISSLPDNTTCVGVPGKIIRND